MNEQEREHSRLAKLSAYRVNATWNIFERLVIEGKNPQEALRLATDALDVWTPWFEENHIEAPEAPDIPTQVEQAAAKVTDAITKLKADIDSKRPLARLMAWWRDRKADERTSPPNGSDNPNSNKKDSNR